MFIRVKGAADPSPTLHHPSPWLFLGCEIISELMFSHLLWSASAIYYDQLLSSMMAGLRDKVKGGVKGGEGWSQPFTSHNPSVYRGFRRKGEGWRVKSRVRFLRAKPRFLQSESIFRMAMVDLPKIFSRCIILCLAKAKSCPSRGQYCAIVRQKVEWASFQLVRTIMTTSRRLSGTS